MDTTMQRAERALYEADEHAWIARQIEALRNGRFEHLDRDTLVEYLTDMAIRDCRELASHFAGLLHHLLKLRMQPDRPPRSWMLAIVHHQQQIGHLLKSIPSLASHADALFEQAYADAARLAAAETGIPFCDFPPQSPWTIASALAFEPPDRPTPAPKRPAVAHDAKT